MSHYFYTVLLGRFLHEYWMSYTKCYNITATCLFLFVHSYFLIFYIIATRNKNINLLLHVRFPFLLALKGIFSYVFQLIWNNRWREKGILKVVAKFEFIIGWEWYARLFIIPSILSILSILIQFNWSDIFVPEIFVAFLFSFR